MSVNIMMTSGTVWTVDEPGTLHGVAARVDKARLSTEKTTFAVKVDGETVRLSGFAVEAIYFGEAE